MNLSFSELERNAYANGDFAMLAVYGPAVDLEEEVDCHEAALEESELEGYARGKKDADDACEEQLSDLEYDLQTAKESLEKAKILMREMLNAFENDNWKAETVKHFTKKMAELD